MQASFLQSMLTNNAKAISAKEMFIADCLDEGRHYRARGETAFMIAEFDGARKARKQLAKLVANQRAMLVELKGHFRDARIVVKKAKVVELGAGIPCAALAGMTSHEVEAGLDRLLSALVIPKADTRQQAA